MILKFEKVNLKKLLSGISILIISIPTSLSVIACNSNQNDTIIDSEKRIINEINNIDYFLTVSINSSVIKVKSQINDDFIKNNFSKEIQELFFWKLFYLIKIINDEDKPLSKKDLLKIKVINAKINYSYGQIKDQLVKLIINVVDN